jgi:hypothetical protein
MQTSDSAHKRYGVKSTKNFENLLDLKVRIEKLVQVPLSSALMRSFPSKTNFRYTISLPGLLIVGEKVIRGIVK